MNCSEQFLKCPLNTSSYAKSQPVDRVSNSSDDDAPKVSRRRTKENQSTLNDSLNWLSDDDHSDEEFSKRRRKKQLRTTKDKVELMVMRDIYEAQTDEVQQIILKLHEMQLSSKRAVFKPKPVIVMKKNKRFSQNTNGERAHKKVVTAPPTVLIFNRKLLATLQRHRRWRGKPRPQKNKHKYPRRKHFPRPKKGNRQSNKYFLRRQKLFNNGISLRKCKQSDGVRVPIKHPNDTATSNCNNNGYDLSKAHRQQIALYKRIENDLHRLNIARHERTEAAAERKAKDKEKESLRQELKNKIETRAAARVERDALKKERRAVRKERALQKKMRQAKAKAELVHPEY